MALSTLRCIACSPQPARSECPQVDRCCFCTGLSAPLSFVAASWQAGRSRRGGWQRRLWPEAAAACWRGQVRAIPSSSCDHCLNLLVSLTPLRRAALLALRLRMVQWCIRWTCSRAACKRRCSPFDQHFVAERCEDLWASFRFVCSRRRCRSGSVRAAACRAKAGACSPAALVSAIGVLICQAEVSTQSDLAFALCCAAANTLRAVPCCATSFLVYEQVRHVQRCLL